MFTSSRSILHFTNSFQGANLIHYSDYTEEQIMPVFRLMIDYLVRPVKHEAFYKKYASKKFHKGKLNNNPPQHTIY